MRTYVVPVFTRYSALLAQFGFVAIITRVLDRDDAGRYFVIMGLVLATYFGAGLGLPDGVVRFAPAIAAGGDAQQANALIRRGLRTSLASVPVGAAIIAVLVLLYTGEVGSAVLSALWWAAYGVIFVSAQTLVAQGRAALGTGLFYSAANAGQVLVSAPLILIAGVHRLETALLATTLGTCLAAAPCLVIAWRGSRHTHAGPVPTRTAWHQGAMIAAGRVVQSCLLWSPVWVASLILGPGDAATVGLASRLVSAVAAVIAAVRFSIRPALARDAAAGDWRGIERDCSRIALPAFALALSAIAVTLLIGDRAIAVLFGSEYRSAALVTALMLIGTVGESFAGPVDEVLRMSGHAAEVLAAQIVAVIVGIGAQTLAAGAGGVAALTAVYGLTFVLLYVHFDYRLRALHNIVVLPRLVREPLRSA